MQKQILIKMYGLNLMAFQANCEGLIHEDSIAAPGTGGTTLNWIGGHLVATRNVILKLVGDEPIWTPEDAEPYVRGAAPLGEDSRAQPWDRILKDMADSQKKIEAGLEKLTDEALAASPGEDAVAGQGTLGLELSFLQFHEAYHVGQIGLMRRLLGKDGAIK